MNHQIESSKKKNESQHPHHQSFYFRGRKHEQHHHGIWALRAARARGFRKTTALCFLGYVCFIQK
jgi:hypothetical protein